MISQHYGKNQLKVYALWQRSSHLLFGIKDNLCVEDTNESRKGHINRGDTVSMNAVIEGKIHTKKETSCSGVVGERG